MNHSRLRWLLVVGGTLLWVLAIYPAYYVVHKPLSPEQFWALTGVAGDLLTWLAMMAVATALGSRLTRRLAYHSLLERLVFSAGLGLIVFSLLTFGLGLLGLLYRWLFWGLLAGGGALLWREFRDLARALRQADWPRPRGRWPVFLSLFVATTLLLTFPLALTPPTNWDSLVYHLVGPERYLQAHRMTYELDNYYLLFPAFTEMLFTAGIALKSDVVPRLIHFGYLLLTIGALSAFAARYWERRLGLLAAALFLSIPTAVWIASWSYVDVALTFCSFAALHALLNWLPSERSGSGQRHATAPPDTLESGQMGWLILAGLFTGASASIKYTGVVSLLIPDVVLLWWLIRRRLTARRFLTGILVVAGLALAVSAPWYLKNAVVTGNPVYPLVWGGSDWNEISARWLDPRGPKASLPDLITLPWRLIVLGQEGTLAYGATFSPLFLALLPLLVVVVRRKAPGLGELLLAAALGYVFWLANGLIATGSLFLNGRLLLPIFAPLSLLCAYGLEGMRIWDRKRFSLRRLLIMLTGLTLAVELLGSALLLVGLNPWPYLAGYQSRDDYQDQYVSMRYHQAITYLNENLAGEDKVLFFWEPRGYGCAVPHEADPLFDNFSQALARYGSVEGMVAGLRSEGFTHLLVNEYIYTWVPDGFPITQEELAAWEELQTRYLTGEALVHAEGEFLKLYRLPATPEP